MEHDRAVLTLKYGDEVTKLNSISPNAPSLENVISAQPQVMFAGWNYGFKDGGDLNPDSLAQHNIGAYVLTESCRKADKTRGTMNLWDALSTDISNIGKMTGHDDVAKAAIDDIDARRKALEAAPMTDIKPQLDITKLSSLPGNDWLKNS